MRKQTLIERQFTKSLACNPQRVKVMKDWALFQTEGEWRHQLNKMRDSE